MSKSRAVRKFPQLAAEDFKYVQVFASTTQSSVFTNVIRLPFPFPSFQIFYEGMHNDARTALAVALSAAEEGAAIANYAEMTEVITDSGGSATGVVCKNRITGEYFEIKAKAIVFAGGPFTDLMRKLEDPKASPAVAGAAGTHIVLPGYYCPPEIGMLDINTSDGRFLFFLPWQGSTLVGTTDRAGNPVSTPGPPEDEIKWLLTEVGKYLSPELRVRRTDVLSAWQGWRPLASDPHAAPGAPISRDHIISTNPQTGITFITGGKWTTYREMVRYCFWPLCLRSSYSSVCIM
jgi:glycerol-3-phosphate dehydrogenase